MKTFTSFSELANASCPNSFVTATCNRLNTTNAPAASSPEGNAVLEAITRTKQALEQYSNILEEHKKLYMQYVMQLRAVVANPQQTDMIQQIKPGVAAFLQKLGRFFPKGAKDFTALEQAFETFAQSASAGSQAPAAQKPAVGATPHAAPIAAPGLKVFNPAA